MAFSNIYKNKKVIITGNTGFKGTWLSTWLKMMGAEVYGYSIGVPGKETGPASLGLDGGGHILRLLYRGTSVCLPATAGDDRTVDFVG